MSPDRDAQPARGTAVATRGARSRPSNRRETIVEIAARFFSDSGYHAVHLGDIATAAGVSTPALYRHFPNKHALFAETARHLADTLTAALEGAHPESGEILREPPGPDAVGITEEPDELRRLMPALVGAAIDNRRTGGLYRWEAQYLDPEDVRYVRDIVVRQHRTIRDAVWRYRPETPLDDANLITAAMVSVAASPATHRASMSTRGIIALLSDAAISLADVDLPPHTPTPPHPAGLGFASRRETLLVESISLFASRGFHDVTVDDIARAAGIPTSGVYRHFPSKAAILEAAFWRASDRVNVTIGDALTAATTPVDAITSLVTNYVAMNTAYPELLTVYMTEIGNVEPEQRRALRSQQRNNVEEWAGWVVRANPDRTPIQARFLVHAALNVVLDLTRLGSGASAERAAALATRLLV